MKRNITANLRLLFRALYAFFIVIAAVWAMPRNASAQGYGIQQPNFPSDIGNVSKYNALPRKVIDFFVVEALKVVKYDVQSGAPIHVVQAVPLVLVTAGLVLEPVLISSPVAFFAGVKRTSAVGLSSADDTVGWVGTYDATTGTPINTSFILFQPPPGVRVDKCTGLALKGGTLFVVFQLQGPGSDQSGIVGTYDVKTGAPINANFITGLNQPSGLAVFGDTLFVTNFGTNSSNGTVGKYDAKTGAVIDANFITGLSNPAGPAVLGNTLLVAEEFKNAVGKYDAKTGAPVNANFITGLSHPIFLALLGHTLFVANFFSGTVGKYDARTGAVIDANLISGLSEPVSIAVGANQNQ